jgi:hypothetical protein
MGTAYAVKKGDTMISDVDPAYRDKVSELVSSMTLKQLKDYAETSHKDLPDRVAESGLHLNPSMNVPGIGDPSLPGDPSSLDSFSSQQTGSGDLPEPKKKKRVMTFEQFTFGSN